MDFPSSAHGTELREQLFDFMEEHTAGPSQSTHGRGAEGGPHILPAVSRVSSFRCRGLCYRRWSPGPGRACLVEHERDRTEQLGTLPEISEDDFHVLGSARDRTQPHRITERIE
jgi:hypothetical protein